MSVVKIEPVKLGFGGPHLVVRPPENLDADEKIEWELKRREKLDKQEQKRNSWWAKLTEPHR